MKRFDYWALLLIAILTTILWTSNRPKPAFAGEPQKPASVDESQKPVAKNVKDLKIDLSKAVDVVLPRPAAALKPAAFQTADGKSGWVVEIPGGLPIATPAYADGMLFVGGGYGSHEFYAFDAETGALRWKINTVDDGPTAAVVEGGYVGFNTESCTVIVVDEKTGKVVWQEWLGDPLMSQPAIYKGRLLMAYPAGPRSPKSHVQGSHRLLSVDLATGKHLWEAAISGDVISAPVIADDHVYITCFDGTSYAFNFNDGSLVWKKENAGTSAPVVANGQVVVPQKVVVGNKSYEGLVRSEARQGRQKDEQPLTKKDADYLDRSNGGGVGLTASQTTSLDSSVGFSSAPQSAQLGKASQNVGVNSVAGAWAYQGSRAAISKGQMLNAQGKYLNSVSAADGKMAWQAEIVGEGVAATQQAFSPPSLGRDYMYLSGTLGHLVSVRQKDGEAGLIYSFKQPMVFQPTLVNGNIYVGTAQGTLICLKTANKDADGWYEWGGNAQHNKTF